MPTPTPIPAAAPVERPPEAFVLTTADVVATPLVLSVPVPAVVTDAVELDPGRPTVVWLRWLGTKLKFTEFAPNPEVVLGRRSNQHGLSVVVKFNWIRADELYGSTWSSLISSKLVSQIPCSAFPIVDTTYERIDHVMLREKLAARCVV
jgi:hypothetical protein